MEKGFIRRHRMKFVIVGTILAILAGYILGTGLTLVGPQTVKIVRQPRHLGSLIIFEQSVPLINDSNHSEIRMIWPRIPWTRIGAKEESYSLAEPLEINTRVKLLEAEDGVVYLMVSGTAKVANWQKFLIEFDPKLTKNPELQNLTYLELAGQTVGKNLLHHNLDYWYQEFQLRAFFADKFAKDYNLTSLEEVVGFIRSQRSWYWTLGVMYFYQIKEEVQRNLYPDQLTFQLAINCITADSLEGTMDLIDGRLANLEWQKQVLCEEFDEKTIEAAESILVLFRDYLETQKKELGYQVQEEFDEFLARNQTKINLPQECYAARVLFNIETEKIRLLDIRKFEEGTASSLHDFFAQFSAYDSMGNESLWRAAILQALEKERFFIGVLEDFYVWLKADDGGMAYLEELARFYQDTWEAMYGVKLDLDFQIIEEVPAE